MLKIIKTKQKNIEITIEINFKHYILNIMQNIKKKEMNMQKNIEKITQKKYLMIEIIDVLKKNKVLA